MMSFCSLRLFIAVSFFSLHTVLFNGKGMYITMYELFTLLYTTAPYTKFRYFVVIDGYLGLSLA